MLIARPLWDSMEWTGHFDNFECCAENSYLCFSKYSEKQAARQKLCYHQREHGVDPKTFLPDLSVPIFTEDMKTSVWI
jgi:hypothetical protein